VTPEKDSSTRNPASPSASKNGKKKSGRRGQAGKGLDPERVRQIESLKLARTEMRRPARECDASSAQAAVDAGAR
jgi:hypothetical protein